MKVVFAKKQPYAMMTSNKLPTHIKRKLDSVLQLLTVSASLNDLYALK